MIALVRASLFCVSLFASMRAAVILGPGSTSHDLEPFKHGYDVEWSLGLPEGETRPDVVLVFGGDGTVHRHLRLLVRLERPVLVVPCGSGNDLARALHLSKLSHALRAWQEWQQGARNVCRIDLGVIIPVQTEERGELAPWPGNQDAPSDSQSSPSQAHYFCCVASCGLDQQAAQWANQMPRRLRARGGYFLGLLAALAHFRPLCMRLTSFPDSSPTERLARQRMAMFVAFANAPFYGGGMSIAPRARLDDGRLDVCLVNRLGRLHLLWLFPTVYFGRHLRVREVEYFQMDRLLLETEAPVQVYADGEYVCRTPIAIQASAAALPVVVGDGFR